jgi:cytochrome c peroxidase
MKSKYVFLAALAVSSALVSAEEVEVLQIKQKFEPGQIEVKAGEPVNFVNADDVKHNLRTVMPDGSKVDHGITKPGENVSFGFDAPGTYQVTCGIHPKMKLEVSVK